MSIFRNKRGLKNYQLWETQIFKIISANSPHAVVRAPYSTRVLRRCYSDFTFVNHCMSQPVWVTQNV